MHFLSCILIIFNIFLLILGNIYYNTSYSISKLKNTNQEKILKEKFLIKNSFNKLISVSNKISKQKYNNNLRHTNNSNIQIIYKTPHRRKRNLKAEIRENKSTPYWRLVSTNMPKSKNENILLEDLTNIQNYVVPIIEEPTLNKSSNSNKKILTKIEEDVLSPMKIQISNTIGEQPTIIQNELGNLEF